MESHASFGYWLTQQRKTLRLTRTELAQRIACAAVTLRKIEEDARRPSAELAAKLAQHLAVAPTEHTAFIQVARGERSMAWLTTPNRLANAATDGTSGGGMHDSVTSRWDSVPHALTSFIGRVAELRRMHELLANPAHRIITIVGPGGCGKTRLAVTLGDQCAAVYSDGICFVALDGIDDPSDLPLAIARALGIFLEGDSDPRVVVRAYLQKRHMLLILDTLEHLLPNIAFLSELLQHARRLTLLATSREPLRVYGETIVWLTGLAIPVATDSDIEHVDAVRLFIERAQSANAGYRVDTLAPVLRICHLVDGLPYGIELAASWTHHLSSATIAQLLETDSSALTSRFTNTPARHHSLDALVRHSWDLLTPDERCVLCRLSASRGEAAGAAADAPHPILSRLADKSLIMPLAAERYRLPEVVRQFAERRLQESAAGPSGATFGAFLNKPDTPPPMEIGHRRVPFGRRRDFSRPPHSVSA